VLRSQAKNFKKNYCHGHNKRLDNINATGINRVTHKLLNYVFSHY